MRYVRNARTLLRQAYLHPVLCPLADALDGGRARANLRCPVRRLRRRVRRATLLHAALLPTQPLLQQMQHRGMLGQLVGFSSSFAFARLVNG